MNQKIHKNYRTINTVLESVDSFFYHPSNVNFDNSINYWFGLIVLPTSAVIVCSLSFGNKVLHKLIINNYNKYRKQYERDQQTIKSFDKLYRKSLQDRIIDKNEYEGLYDFSTNYVDENKKESFL